MTLICDCTLLFRRVREFDARTKPNVKPRLDGSNVSLDHRLLTVSASLMRGIKPNVKTEVEHGDVNFVTASLLRSE